jgi:hypothetical protein
MRALRRARSRGAGAEPGATRWAGMARDVDRDGRASLLAQEMLHEARALVARGWCQGATGEDDDGNAIEPWSSAARRWSTVGALVAVWADRRRASHDRDDAIAAFQRANLALLAAVDGQFRSWNDAPGRTREHVVTAFDRAIELA